nr:MAG TPA: hypothetical protein [Caudoviricetes sp.]
MTSKKIGTLADQIKLSDEEIDALPAVIKCLKHDVLCDSEERKMSEEEAQLYNLVREITDLNEFRCDLSMKGDALLGTLLLEMSLTAVAKQKNAMQKQTAEKEEFNAVKRYEVLAKELQKRDDEVSRLKEMLGRAKADLADAKMELANALAKVNPNPSTTFPGFGSSKNYWMSDNTSGATHYRSGEATCKAKTSNQGDGITAEQKDQAKKIHSLLDEIFDSADYFTKRM